jgi:Fe-S cluster assembly iron-binding protein IscA
MCLCFGLFEQLLGPIMIEVTPRAIKLMAKLFKDKPKQPIHLFVKLGACGIRSFGVGLETPGKTDVILEVDGYEFFISKRLLKKVAPIKVDADLVGFRISGSGVYPPSGCGSCGFMCGASGSGRCSGDCLTCKLPCSHGRRVRERMKEREERKAQEAEAGSRLN